MAGPLMAQLRSEDSEKNYQMKYETSLVDLLSSRKSYSQEKTTFASMVIKMKIKKTKETLSSLDCVKMTIFTYS